MSPYGVTLDEARHHMSLTCEAARLDDEILDAVPPRACSESVTYLVWMPGAEVPSPPDFKVCRGHAGELWQRGMWAAGTSLAQFAERS